jgi:c-di-AMP phosphodiesterase-like protein
MDVGQFDERDFLRRRNAAAYLLKKYGFGAEKTLAKGAVTGDSPEYRKAGRLVLYTREALDKWALAKIGAPQNSSSDAARLPRKMAQEPSGEAP